MQNIQGPAWDNSSEYLSISDQSFQKDSEQISVLRQQLEKKLGEIQPLMQRSLAGTALSADESAKMIASLQAISQIVEQGMILCYDLSTFVSCELSIDAQNENAKKVQSVVQQRMSEFQTAQTPMDLFLARCSSDIFEKYLKSLHTEAERFVWEQKRRVKDWTLSEAEEITLSQFRQYGPTSWGDLYDQISGALKVKMPSKGEVGLAEASGHLRSAEEKIRREAWQGIQTAWKEKEDSAAAILNSLAGWRLEEYQKRSSKKQMHFLDRPLLDARIERSTLDAMMEAIQQNIQIPRRGLKAMARCLGKSKVDPWDLLAPSPRASKDEAIPWADALAKVRNTFADIEASAGEFIDLMAKNRWLEGRVLPNKRQGAYCTGFMKSRSPRVYQTFMGSLEDTSTLAHELGHAYHSWVMRDLPLIQTDYPMTLAETASTFAETALADSLMKSGSAEMKFEVAWASVAEAVGLLLNIPARFDFEKSFYEKRSQGFVTPKELCALTDQAWRKWFGDDLSQTEQQYWMTKLHFSISGLSFYNFPYSFGYLFALNIYSRRKTLGDRFGQAYRDILRDTGRMTAESVIEKHFGEDIRKPTFWLKGFEIVNEKVTRFEQLISTH